MTREIQQYNGWIVSNSFWKRGFAIFMHYTIISIFIAIITSIIVFAILTIFGISIYNLVPTEWIR